MKCPYCDKSLDDDWNARHLFLKHISNCLDELIKKNKSDAKFKEEIDVAFTLESPGWDKFYTYNEETLAAILKLDTPLINFKDLPETFESELYSHLKFFEEFHGLLKEETIDDKSVFKLTDLGLKVQALMRRGDLNPFAFCRMEESSLFMYHPFVRFVYRQREGLTKELYKELEAFPLFKLEKINEHN